MGLILTQAVTKCRLATKAGEAMFFDEDVDFSAYAGGTKLIAFKDSGNRFAYAYASTVGGGEALGVDVLAGFDFTSGWTPTRATVLDLNSFVATGSSGQNAYVYKSNIGALADRLYKNTLAAAITAGTLSLQDGLGNLLCNNNTSKYVTSVNVGGLLMNSTTENGATTDVSVMTMFNLTNVPVTGLLLVSAYGGATRGMLSTEAGFLPNSIVQVLIYNVVAPSTPSPADGATVAYTTSQALQVTNADSGACDIKFYTGAGVQIGATQSGVAAGATATVTATGLSAGLQSWYATATNSVGTVSSPVWSYTILSSGRWVSPRWNNSKVRWG